MIMWKVPPADHRVERVVEAYWYISKSGKSGPVTFPKLYPDVSPHLIITDAHYTSIYECDEQRQDVQGSHWLFPHTVTYLLDHSRSFNLLGIKVKPGQLNALASTFENCKVNALQPVDILSLDESSLLNRAKSDAKGVCAQLDALLKGVIKKHQSQLIEDRIKRAITMLSQGVPCSKIGELVHCSQSTLERNFRNATALNLKEFQTALRIEAVIEYLHESGSQLSSWTDIACQFGFSDQSHFIRSLNKALGATPGEYREQRDCTIDAYSDFEQD